MLAPLDSSWHYHGYQPWQQATPSELLLTRSCCRHIVPAMLLLHSCGKRSTGLGELQLPRPKNKIKLKYQSSNHIPWIIIGICNVSCMSLLLIIRYVLSTENKRRDQEEQHLDNNYDDVYIERLGKDGQVEKVKVDKVKTLFFLCSWWLMRINWLNRLYLFRNSWILRISKIVISDMFCSLCDEILWCYPSFPDEMSDMKLSCPYF